MTGEDNKKSDKPSPVLPLRPPRPCPECAKPSTRDNFPFCSPRCRAVDLNRWLSGNYVLPGKELTDTDEQD